MTNRRRGELAESARWEAAIVASEQRQVEAARRAEQAAAGDTVDTYGFRWGPVVVQRTAAITRPGGGQTRVVRILSDCPGQSLSIYISPTGARIRVFRGGRELR